MKKNILIVVILLLLILVTGCSNKYISNYKATVMNIEQDTNTCAMTFDKFEGTYVFKVKKINGNEGGIDYCIT